MPAWIDTSSADTGSSSARIFGCSASARAMPMRCFCPPENSAGYRLASSRRSPTMPSSSATRSSMRFLSKPLACNGSASTSNTGSRGSSEATGSWNTTCRSPRSARRAAAVQRRDVGAEHLDRTRLRGGQLQDLVQRRRLARPGFADDAQRAALLQFEADAVDRTHLADLAAKHHALGQLVGLDQVPDAQHDGCVGGGCGRRAARWRRRRSRPRCGRRRGRCGCTRPRWSWARLGHAAPVRRRGSRRWPAGSAARTGSRAAARPSTAARRDRHQPRALRRRPGGAPSRAARRCRASGGRGTARRRARSRRPCPAYITSARSANSATTPRSWVMIRTPAPVTSRAVLSTSRICACTVTSSAVVGSSQISRSGSLAIAIAMTTRCRSPPDSSCGNARARRSGWAMPTSSSSSTARARAARLVVPRWWISIASAIWSPTV